MQKHQAMTQLQKECVFLGIGFFDLIKDIQINGRLVYSEKTIEAYHKYMEIYAMVAQVDA